MVLFIEMKDFIISLYRERLEGSDGEWQSFTSETPNFTPRRKISTCILPGTLAGTERTGHETLNTRLSSEGSASCESAATKIAESLGVGGGLNL